MSNIKDRVNEARTMVGILSGTRNNNRAIIEKVKDRLSSMNLSPSAIIMIRNKMPQLLNKDFIENLDKMSYSESMKFRSELIELTEYLMKEVEDSLRWV